MGLSLSLAVPAIVRKMVEKRLASGTDGVFLDLEDAVASEKKADTRKIATYCQGDHIGAGWNGRSKTPEL